MLTNINSIAFFYDNLAILNIYINVSNGLVVYPKIVRRRLMNELPFMATENIMMAAVKKGGDRQELHEKIRQHSVAAAKRVKEEGAENDLLERIAADPSFALEKEEIAQLLNPDSFVGRAPKQTEEYLKTVVYPRIAPYIESGKLKADEGLKV